LPDAGSLKRKAWTVSPRLQITGITRSAETKTLGGGRIRVLIEIDRVNAERLEALGARGPTVGTRAVDGIVRAAFDVSELGGQEDAVPFAGAFEPSAEKLFPVAVKARVGMRVSLYSQLYCLALAR